MNKHLLQSWALSTALVAAAAVPALAADNEPLLLNAGNSTIVFTTGDAVEIQYIGAKITAKQAASLMASDGGLGCNSYPAFGIGDTNEKALTVEMPDGNLSADLKLTATSRSTGADGETITFTYADKAYPLTVRQHYKAYKGTDVFATWTEIANTGKKEIKLLEFASACIPVTRADNYLTHFHGDWARESYMSQMRLPQGQTVITSHDAVRNAFASNAGFMVSAYGEPQENTGYVLGGNLVYTGDYKTTVVVSESEVRIISGINPDHSTLWLKGGETFKTPEFVMTASNEGKGGVSRAFHRWARQYCLHGADTMRDILLNSWEGVYFDVNQEVMEQMMTDIHALGGELFVMDDGWFGNKYPRNDDTMGLGDWQVNKAKLPLGVKGLTDAAKRIGIKFGLWIEPEMANTASDLVDRHPDWVLQQKNRDIRTGRGGSQVVLDMCNPKVQDFVFGIVDNLMTENPDIAYMKWDCNASFLNYGSTYLPANRQSELSVRFNQGLQNVCERIRAKYPKLVLQACSSGGGRVNYGMLRYFDEFWTSDDTDAVQRIFIQWGDSHFYPAQAMASHVSVSPNEQSGRLVPLKFRFDVAMTGRLGMELQPKDMTEADKAFSARAIAAYKQIRPLVQQGDLYRLRSPYAEGNTSALMYTNADKSEAAVFVHRVNALYRQHVAPIKLDGVDENRDYLITDLTPENPEYPCSLNGKVVSGRVLKQVGLDVGALADRALSSAALHLVAQ